MSDVERLLEGGVERQTADRTDAVVPPRLSTRDDGHGQVTPRPHLRCINDGAWAVAFKLNVAITVISVSASHVTRSAFGYIPIADGYGLGWFWAQCNGRRERGVCHPLVVFRHCNQP